MNSAQITQLALSLSVCVRVCVCALPLLSSMCHPCVTVPEESRRFPQFPVVVERGVYGASFVPLNYRADDTNWRANANEEVARQRSRRGAAEATQRAGVRD